MNSQREEYLLKKYIGADAVKALHTCNAFIAGGAITALFTGQKIRDWDVYFRSAQDCLNAQTWFGINGKLVNETDTSKSYQLGKSEKPFQLIVMPELFGSPTEIFKCYDFTVCMGAYDFSVNAFAFGDDFLKHIAQRRLVFHTGTMFPICSLLRVMKYVRRGFFISGMEIIKIGLSIHSLKIDNFKELRRQLQGIDTAFLADLTVNFKEDPIAVQPYVMEQFIEMMDQYVKDRYEHLTMESEEES